MTDQERTDAMLRQLYMGQIPDDPWIMAFRGMTVANLKCVRDEERARSVRICRDFLAKFDGRYHVSRFTKSTIEKIAKEIEGL